MAMRRKKRSLFMRVERKLENSGPAILGAGSAAVVMSAGAALPAVAIAGIGGVTVGAVAAQKKLLARQDRLDRRMLRKRNRERRRR